MDKDLILMVGGALVAAVVLHGMWLTWRARRDRLPMQLAADVPEAEYGDGDVLGPPRVVSCATDQGSLGLWSSEDGREAPAPIVASERAPADPLAVAPIVPDDSAPVVRREAAVALRAAPPVETVPEDDLVADVAERVAPVADVAESLAPVAAAAEAACALDETESLAALEAAPAVAIAGAGALRAPGLVPAVVDAAGSAPSAPDAVGDRSDVEAPEPMESESPRRVDAANPGGDADAPPANGRDRTARQRTSGWRDGPRNGDEVDGQGEEIFVINVLARNGDAFNGADLFEVFMRNALKFRDMNIFHRLDPVNGGVRFSVANAVEPGIFDLSDMASLETPGVSLFFRLPGPDQPGEVLDDMLGVARDIGKSLGGDLKDEYMSVLTGQTLSHFKQRMAEFSRKRMSMRAAHG